MEVYAGLIIEAAADEGYFVQPIAMPGDFRPILFAGPLADALDYVRASIVKRPTAAPAEPPPLWAYADDAPLADMELSMRTQQIVDSLGAVTAGDIRRLTDAELLRTPNCGRKSLNELRELTKITA